MRTLFIGNSHTYVNDLPKRFADICEKYGCDMEVTLLARGGIGFEDHAEEPQTRFNVLYGRYDWIVLQHRAHPMGDLNAMEQGLKAILTWCREAKSTPVLYQTWAKKGDENSQEAMSSVYDRLGTELGIKVAPVGREWQKFRTEHPEIELFAEDGEHASAAGTQLAAQVIFDTILGR